METRANYVLVGVFVLALTAAALFFALWLAKAQYETATETYDIYFVGPVTGLKKGSSVSYRGIAVGEVVNLKIDPTNIQRVVVTIEIEAKTPIRTDTVASLEVQGIAGGVYVLLTGGTQSAPPLKARDGQPYPVIPSVPSRIEQVLQSAPAAVEHINLLLARANELLRPENRLAITNALQNLDKFTGALAEESPDIKKAIADFTVTIANLRDTTAQLDRVVAHADSAMDSIGSAAGTANRAFSEINDQTRPLIADLRQTSKSMTEMANEIGGMVAENREPIRNFSGSASVEFTSLLADMRDLVNHLDRLTTEIERDPARFFFGNHEQGYDVNKK